MGSLHSVLVALTGVCFLIFLVAWSVGAVYFGAKHPAGAGGWLRDLRRTFLRRIPPAVSIGVLIVVIKHTPHSIRSHLRFWQPELALLGAVIVLASTALLLWARWVLGTMWSSIPMVQEQHELRTDGPYALVRHPIYTGLFGLIIGSVLTCGFGVWVVILAAAVPWLLRRVRVEDRMMADQFGASYDAYRARVPALVPWPRHAVAGRR